MKKSFYNIFDYIDTEGRFLANVDLHEAGEIVSHVERKPFNYNGGLAYSSKIVFTDRMKALAILSQQLGLQDMQGRPMETLSDKAEAEEGKPKNSIAAAIKEFKESQ